MQSLPSSSPLRLGRSILYLLPNTPDVKVITCLRHTWLNVGQIPLSGTHATTPCGWRAGPLFQRCCALSASSDPCWVPLYSALFSLAAPDSTDTSFTNIYKQKSHDGRPRKAPSTLFEALCNGYSAIFWSVRPKLLHLQTEE